MPNLLFVLILARNFTASSELWLGRQMRAGLEISYFDAQPGKKFVKLLLNFKEI